MEGFERYSQNVLLTRAPALLKRVLGQPPVSTKPCCRPWIASVGLLDAAPATFILQLRTAVSGVACPELTNSVVCTPTPPASSFPSARSSIRDRCACALPCRLKPCQRLLGSLYCNIPRKLRSEFVHGLTLFVDASTRRKRITTPHSSSGCKFATSCLQW